MSASQTGIRAPRRAPLTHLPPAPTAVAGDTEDTAAGVQGARLDIEGLVVDYAGGHRALDGVDLEVPPGQVVALVGANGSGKSTLLRCLVRLVPPTSGRVRIDDTDTTSAKRAELRRARTEVGFVFQRFHLVPRRSAFYNVLQGAVGRRGSRCVSSITAPRESRDEAMGLLTRVGLGQHADRRMDRLSGGQQQRVAIARMLMQRPRVILADEPVASLDPVAGIGVMDLLREVATERGLTAMVALHHLDLALDYAERVVGLRDGQIALDRPTAACEGGDLDELYHLVER